ncbi:YetF domain-containing protein [Paenibacillus rhizoplanae]
MKKVTQHIRKLRKPLEGEPEILIRDGKVDLEKLRRNNLDFEQLRMMLRAKDTFFYQRGSLCHL